MNHYAVRIFPNLSIRQSLSLSLRGLSPLANYTDRATTLDICIHAYVKEILFCFIIHCLGPWTVIVTGNYEI
jgi:hypothetical protein